MSLSVTAYPFPWGCRVLLLEPIPALSQGEGRVLPGQVTSSLQGKTDEQYGVQYLAQGHFDMQLSPETRLGFEPATFRSLVDLLHLLSYSRPVLGSVLRLLRCLEEDAE